VAGQVKERERVVVDLENDKIIFRTAKDLIKDQPKREEVTV